MELKDVDFPIYMLPKYSTTWEEDSVVYLESKEGIRYTLDNKSLDKKVYANRRMDMMRKNNYQYPLFPLKKRIQILAQLLQKGGKTKFIDNKGQIFAYEKGDKMCPLVLSAILHAKPAGGYGTFLYTVDSPSPLFVPVYFDIIPKYAVLIDTRNSGYLLYDLTNESSYPKRRIKL